MSDVHAARDQHELEAENARLRAIINKCQWYWQADDPEYSFSEPWEVVEELDHGTVVEVWRGGPVETMFVARVGDEMINEPTLEAANAKAKKLLEEFWKEDEA